MKSLVDGGPKSRNLSLHKSWIAAKKKVLKQCWSSEKTSRGVTRKVRTSEHAWRTPPFRQVNACACIAGRIIHKFKSMQNEVAGLKNGKVAGPQLTT